MFPGFWKHNVHTEIKGGFYMTWGMPLNTHTQVSEGLHSSFAGRLIKISSLLFSGMDSEFIVFQIEETQGLYDQGQDF